jgi:glycyl-tRNA synthetase beta chain
MSNVEDLLVEIGVEELPARFVRPALEQLQANAVSGLKEARLESRRVLGFATPRRLAVIVEGLSAHQEHDTSVLTGPPVKVAFDAEGAPTKAAEGFARRAGVPVGALTTVRTPSGEYLRAEVHDEGRPAVDVLPGVIVSWVQGLSFQKNMVWNDAGFRFARPIRWLLAILGGRPIEVEIAGLRSGVHTWGHRFLSGEVEIPSADRYVDLLRDAGVIVDQDERRKIIEEGLGREAARLGGRAVDDERLLEEVTFLVELPTVVAGAFDPSHTSMPRDVVVTAMREHQRYFAVEREDGSLLPNFITVLNTGPEAVEGSIRGNERVLEARLADARFYWDLDLGKSFEGLMEGLKGVGWHADFGTLFDKSKRLAALASSVAEKWCPESKPGVERAAFLCKADLASDMVKDGKEFTGLQGSIGGEYALRWGEPPEVVQAIREHYLPRFAGDVIPESIGGAAVSVADRVDNVVGGFGAGKAPTGSEDPYALRRAANGVIRILLERELHISMLELFSLSCGLMKDYLGDRGESVLSDVLQFWVTRGDAYFGEREVPYDIADAVLSVSFDDPVDSWKRCRALMRFRPDESFPALVIGFKRAANILRDNDEGIGLDLRQEALSHEAERSLLSAVERASALVEEALAATDYESAIQTQLGLRPAIDSFFDDVLVMDKDPAVRATRLALLRRVHSLFLKTWDLSKIALET